MIKFILLIFGFVLINTYNINFTPDDYKQRVDKVKQMIVDSELDAFITTSAEDIYYFSGISIVQQSMPFFMVFYPDIDPAFLVIKIEEEHISDSTAIPVSSVLTYWDAVSRKYYFEDNMKALLGSRKRIGINPTMLNNVEERLDNMFKDDDDYTLDKNLKLSIQRFAIETRMIKSDKEIALIRRAVGMADQLCQHILDYSYHGASVLEIVGSVAPVVQQLQLMDIFTGNYDILKFFTRAGTFNAPHSARPHAIPPLFSQLLNGPQVAVCQVRAAGYFAETERTYFLDTPTEFEINMFNHMLIARSLALSEIYPGNTIKNVVDASDLYLQAEGLIDFVKHSVGHGMGQTVNEEPHLTGLDFADVVLQPGMIFTIEPAVYIPGVGGFRHSDTIVVTADGYEVLGKLPTDLGSLTKT